tara:strand:- start:46 stop:495 length:450 start_codon:yes stop_codon:yes gene_type:complete
MTDALEQLEQVKEAISEALGDAYDCTRVWSAWSHGTMTDDDFTPVSDDEERLSEIASAAINAISSSTDIARKVKPLKWVQSENFKCSVSGRYTVQSEYDANGESCWVFGFDGVIVSEHQAETIAEAAAQAHHDALIRSALVTQVEGQAT